MSKAEYWQRGESIDYKNTGSSAIEANSVIVLGKRVEKDDSEITAGAEVYVTAAGKMTTTASGNTAAGFATEAAKAAETSVLVNINA